MEDSLIHDDFHLFLTMRNYQAMVQGDGGVKMLQRVRGGAFGSRRWERESQVSLVHGFYLEGARFATLCLASTRLTVRAFDPKTPLREKSTHYLISQSDFKTSEQR